MSRKKSRPKSARSPIKKSAEASSLKAPPKKQIFAMDAFRAMDTASKQAILNAKVSDGFQNFAENVGLGTNTQLSDSTYTFNYITKNRVLLEAAYRGSWIVGAVVDSVAEDMTRAGIDITTSDKADLKVIFKEMTRLQIWQSVARVVKWGRLYGGAIGVLNIEGQDLATPLDPETVAKSQFKGILVYDRWLLNPVLQNVIESGPDLGLPKFYQIVTNLDAASPDAQGQVGMKDVHHSRVFRYTGIDLPYFQAITEMMWGESVLERLWDRLISFDNASMSSANLIERANNRVISVNGLREIIAAGGDAQKGLESQFEMMRVMQSNDGLTLLDKEDEFDSISYSFAGLSDMLLQFGQQLSGACGIPLARLFSQHPAGLNPDGDSDIRMYYDNINAQQESKLRDPFDTILKVMWRSTYGVSVPEDMDFTFSPLWQMSAADKAANAKVTADTVVVAFDAGLIPQKTAMEELRDSSGDTGIFSNITDEDIASADEELPPQPDPNALPLPTGKPGNAEGEGKKTPSPSQEPVKAKDSFFKWLIKR